MDHARDHFVLAAADLPEVFGPYRIQKRLGQGGMGSVYLALDTRLNRKIALKVCHLGDKPEVLARFRREAQAAAALRHPNLCPVYECDVLDGIPYFTMAFIEGPTLGEWVEQRGGTTQREAALLVAKVALTLQDAHGKGVVHRDLKPANIVIEKGEPIVVDFGLARFLEPHDKKLTRSGAILGTPSYMAPEQVEGNTSVIGPYTDIHGLGVILYELLTGRLPFEGPLTAVLASILTQEPPPLRAVRADVDEHLEEICLKALAKNPADRWPSMADLAKALTDWAHAAPRGQRVTTAPNPPAETWLTTKGKAVASNPPAPTRPPRAVDREKAAVIAAPPLREAQRLSLGLIAVAIVLALAIGACGAAWLMRPKLWASVAVAAPPTAFGRSAGPGCSAIVELTDQFLGVSNSRGRDFRRASAARLVLPEVLGFQKEAVQQTFVVVPPAALQRSMVRSGLPR